MNIKKNLDGRNRTITIFLCFLIITYLIPVVFPLEIAPYWQEDGVIESLGAFFFLIASLFLFGAFFRLRKIKLAVHKKFETIWILALGLLFFVAFGEEISWGQRIFNFDTPEALKEINHQKEFNLHNINMVHGLDENGERKTGIAALITSHRLFYALLIGYFIIIPLIMLFSIWPQRLFTVLQMPVAPVWIGCIFFAVLLLVKITQFLFARNNPDLYHGLVEIMETNIALVTSLLGWSFYKSEFFKRETDPLTQ
jgi:hypothetical protein